MSAALLVALLDTAYLAWRFVALDAGWVQSGNGLCSWTTTIDCDLVLATPEARAFWVPNAILGWGFFSAASLWWFASPRVAPSARRLAAQVLAGWMGAATVLTFWFWWLLLNLPFLCPFCPWNHIWTYVGLAGALSVARARPEAATRRDRRRLFALFVACSVWFLSCQVGWALMWGGL